MSKKQYTSDEIRELIKTQNWTVGSSQQIMTQLLEENEQLRTGIKTLASKASEQGMLPLMFALMAILNGQLAEEQSKEVDT